MCIRDRINGITATPSMAGVPFVVGRDTGSLRSAHFAGHLKFDSPYGLQGTEFEIFGNTSGLYLKSLVSSDNIIFETNDGSSISERLRITSNGNVLVNQTVEFGSAVKLSVRGASSAISDGAQIFDVTTTAAASGGTRLAFGVNEDNYTWIRSYESAVGGIDMVFATNTERLRIHSSGLVEANSSFSDTYTSTTSINPHLRARNQNGTDNIYGGIQLRADRGTGAASIFNIACLNTSTNFESIPKFVEMTQLFTT